MKVNGFTIETIKGAHARYGLTATAKKMQLQIFDQFRTNGGEFTAEEAAEFSAEVSEAAHILLTDGELVDEKEAPAHPIPVIDENTPVEQLDEFIRKAIATKRSKSGPSCAGYDTHEIHIYCDGKRTWATYKHGDTTKRIDSLATSEDAENFFRVVSEVADVMNKRVNPPVREVPGTERPAQVGEWVKILTTDESFYSAGEIRQVLSAYRGGSINVKALSYNTFDPYVPSSDYSVLENYRPEASHD